MNLIKLSVLSIFMMIAISVRAQLKISGAIIDHQTNEAVEFANIALLKNDSTFIAGVSSDKNGKFSISNISKGNYIISAAYVGYAKNYIEINNLNQNIDLGMIELTPSDVTLKDVTVTGNSVINKADRQIILPTEAQVRTSTNGMSLLQNLQLSRIEVNPLTKSITVPGKGAVQLRLNGLEVTSAEIIALNPADIVRIEYHDEPGLRYGNAPAVLDYITRRKESGGSIALNLGNAPYGIGWAEDYASAKVNHKKSEFSANGYWSYRNIEWIRENKEIFIFPDKVLERNEIGLPTKYKDKKLNLSLNYNLQETDKYMLNVKLRNNYNNIPNQFTNRTSTIYSSDNSKPLLVSDESTWKSSTPSLDIYYQRHLKNDQLLIFNIVGVYIDSKSTRSYMERNNGDTITNIFSNISGDKYTLIGEGIYEKQFKAGKLSVGIKHSQSYTENSYSGNVKALTGMNVAETYGFAEYQFKKKKFNYTLGMGIMRTYNSQGENNNEKYILRPTLKVSYTINDNASVRYHGYISGYAPSLGDLNNVEQYIDSLQIRRGNPNLKTVTFYSNALSANYNKGIFSADLYINYSYDRKPIMESVSFDNDKQVFIRASMNQKSFHRFSVQTSLKLKPWKDYISLRISPRVNRFISYGNDYTHTYTSWGMSGSLTANYKKWFVMTEVYTRWNNYWAETLDIGEKFHLVGVGYNTPKWNLMLGMFMPFSKNYTQARENHSKLTPVRSDLFNRDMGQLLMVNFGLNLNFGRKYNSAQKRLNNDDTDAGIMSGTKK